MKMRDILDEATTGLVTDYMDNHNLPYQFLGTYELNQSQAFLLGQIRTIECEAGPFDDENIVTGLGYLDQCQQGDILFVKGSQKFAYFGELMSRVTEKRGLQGAIIEGNTRDARFTGNHVPVFARGYSPVDIKGRGRVKAVGVPISINGVIVDETMYAAADKDGVLVFKRDVIAKVTAHMLAEIKHERKLKDMISAGANIQQLLEITKGF